LENQGVALLAMPVTCILAVQGSNPGWVTNYPNEALCDFLSPSVLSVEVVPCISPWLLSLTCFPIRYSLIIFYYM
jgi:hypothetical protein